LAILGNKVINDLLICPTLRQFIADLRTPILAGFGLTDIQRRVGANRTIQLLGDPQDIIVGGRLPVLGMHYGYGQETAQQDK